MSDVLHLQLERGRYAPGEVVCGVVTVMLGQDSRTLSVSCDYCEETSDYMEVGASSGSVVLCQGPLVAGQSFPFALTLPAEALPAFRARHGKLFWRVDAKSDRGGRDPHTRLPIDVIPPDAGGAIMPVASFETAAAQGPPPPPPPPPPGVGVAPAPTAAVTTAPVAVPSAPAAPTAIPAGWYADPSGQAPYRYWDGSAWTSHTA